MKVILVLMIGANFHIEEPTQLVITEYDSLVQCQNVAELYETKDILANCVMEEGK
jgi:hypothetical protein